MRRSIQSARGTQIIRGGQTSRLPGGQEVEDRFAPWKSYPLSGHWRRPQLLRSTFRSAPESCPCCVSPTMRCGRLPSRSDVNIGWPLKCSQCSPSLFHLFHFFAEYWLCKYRETTIHAKQWKIPKVSKVSAVALRGSSRMYPSVSIFFDRPCPIVFSQIVANLNIYHSIRNILWQILNWYDLISIIFNFPFKSPKMVLTISSSLLITGPPRRLARRGRRPRGRQRKMVTFPGSGWGSQSERCAFGVFFGAWGLVLSPIAVIYNYNIYICISGRYSSYNQTRHYGKPPVQNCRTISTIQV